MRVVVATGNPGKLAELRDLLGDAGLELVAQSELGIAEVDETGTTFVENAIIKARHAARAAGLPALADDSGLLVDALGGAPGLYSARYAGPRATAADNIARLLQALEGVPDDRRAARFHACIVLLRHGEDPVPLIAEGTWPGRILQAPRGAGGFGYDPVFFDPAQDASAAELAEALKNRISHRGRAVAALRERLASMPR
ncbi:RdgB/HAM1 family non-canonical purine NTP pyrophosphatase [Pseudofulvimonas gallinarii]|uniref:dITP/XTP pyrophosphatase n=1 Tax=Pseudofulvimonas gallinarii TaxID=634155 RepID=A0A4S3KVU2_9GAMM|nr:RdgB/HAM1 family non-canonical purine NTP pyrophosphatase [Pseudofulvimonas gallinarii]TCS96040.1 XTP/dITP diphosphohydrolase [Pseudofulvimonas gallinarii]THD13290.1 non-canonical purine NTP pyrophosphatase, RdgB/HAM1 family [Pseudofulvimonas gallinarii]